MRRDENERPERERWAMRVSGVRQRAVRQRWREKEEKYVNWIKFWLSIKNICYKIGTELFLYFKKLK